MTTGGGTLPLRKPGIRRSRPSVRGGLLDASLDLLRRDLGLDPDARLGELGDGGLHGGGHRAWTIASGHGRAARPSRPRRRTAARAAWLVTGPVGHLAGGVADWAELLTRYVLARARERPRDVQ